MSRRLTVLKGKVAFLAVVRLFAHPAYIILALAGTLLVSGFVVWSLNGQLLAYVLFAAPITLWAKLGFLVDSYRTLFTVYDTLQSIGLVVFAVLFGINLATMVYVLRHRSAGSIPKKSGIGGLGFAVLGGGCVACGTSVIAPLLATIGASSGPFVRDLGTAFNVFGSLLILYSLYKLGAICANIQALRKQACAR